MTDIASLIQMASGEPTLSDGQKPIISKVDATPTTPDLIIKNTGVEAKPLTPAQQSNASTLHSLANGAMGNAQPAPVVAPAPTPAPPTVVEGPLQPPRVTNNLPPLGSQPHAMGVTDPGHPHPAASPTFTTGIVKPPAATTHLPPMATAAPQGNPPLQQVSNVAPEWAVLEGDDCGAIDAEFESDDEEGSPDFMNLVAVAPVVQEQIQPPKPSAPVEVATQPPSLVLQAVEVMNKRFGGDDELAHIQQTIANIEQQVQQARFDSGIALLANPQQRDKANYLHECIYRVKWEAQKLYSLGPHELLAMEAALTAHQVWVQGQENYWSGRARLLDTELTRIVFIKRDNYASSTKTESENRLIAAEPQIRLFRNDCLMAQSMATLYKDQGARFAQLEDGIKRTISLAVDEFNRSKFAAGSR